MECGNAAKRKVKGPLSCNRGGRKVKEEGARTGDGSKAAEHFASKIKEFKTDRRRKRKINDQEALTDNGVIQDIRKREEKSENECSQSNREDNSPKEPSRRQMKKEKAEQRENAEKEAKKLQSTEKALDYISKWKHARYEWKFMKVRQIWLIDNIFDETAIPDRIFPNVLEYFEGCKGMARQQLLTKGMDVVRKVEENEENQQAIVESIEYKRARELLQILPMET